MKKVTILCLHLNYGGIERFITTLANSISDDYCVEIVSTYKLLDEPFFKLKDNISVKYLKDNLKPNKYLVKQYLKQFKFIKMFKELLVSLKVLYYKKYRMIDYIKNCDSDIIISTRDIHNKWLGKYAKDGIKKIGSEHNDINSSKYLKKVSKSAKRLDYLVVVSNKMFSDYKAYLDIPVVYIPNALESMPDKVSKLDSKNVISVGRLETVKGFEDLIDVFKLIIERDKAIHLDIVGAGSLKNVLQAKINSLNLNDNIKLLGYKNTDELSNLYNKASLYVMASQSESFGLVLLEAMSHKLPCIAFDSASGANEIIDSGSNGYLIKDRNREEMANIIVNLINNKDKLEQMGEEALKCSEKYLSNNLKEKWVDLFEK